MSVSEVELYLREEFSQAWQGQDPFAVVDGLEGEIFRELEQRRTLAFHLNNKRYFVKQHKHTTWKEIFKNLIQLRLPVVSARNEWLAIKALSELGIKVPVVAAYGNKGKLPSTLHSFLITEDVGPHQTLEDVFARWQHQPASFMLRLQLLNELAKISRRMHGNGICHRDFYLCHILLTAKNEQELFVIDLHRALVKKQLGLRWIVKDLGSLYFSAMQFKPEQKDLFRFIKIYSGNSLRQELTENIAFWQAVKRRALKLYNND